MLFFKKKNKKKLFGNQIEVSCSYCSYNNGTEDDPACSLDKRLDEDGLCPQFAYDPLLRTPRALPPLREYDAEDFML